ncbi:MAG: alpha/beta hydrolase [Myxococcales bacterium]
MKSIRQRFSVHPWFVLCLLLGLSACQRMGMGTIKDDVLLQKYGRSNSLFMTIDGTKAHYRIEGNPEGPGLLLLHGVLADTHTWDGWIEELGKKYHILVLDIPGFGLSEPLANKNYTPEYAIEFFEKARLEGAKRHPEFADKTERFYLAGNSLGGFIAWYYATKHPERVQKLILIDPIAYQQPLPRIIKFASGGFGGTLAQIAAPRFIVRRNVRKVYGHPESVSDETVLRYHELLLKKGHKTSMVEYFKVLRRYNDLNSMAAHVREIKVPTLLMWGGKDRWVPRALIDTWKADVEGLEVKVYPEGGHIPMEEFPQETARDADAFLSAGEPANVASSGSVAPASQAGRGMTSWE